MKKRTVLSVRDSIPSTTTLCRFKPLTGQLIFTLQLVPRKIIMIYEIGYKTRNFTHQQFL